MRVPTILTKDQKKIWRDVLLESPHINCPEYRELLVVYVVSYDRFLKYSATLEKTGPLIQDARGQWKKSPLVAICNAQANTVTSLSTKLSLTYRSRKNDVGAKERKDHSLVNNDGSSPKKRGPKPNRLGPPVLRIA